MKKTIRLMMAMLVMLVMMVVGYNVMAAGYPVDNPYPGTPQDLPSNMWMVTSTKALESYAKQQVCFANSYGGSAGTILPGGKTWAEVATNHPDIRVIQQLLSNEELSFRVLDPEADQFFYAQLRDQIGYGLFWGWTQYKLARDKYGNWQVPNGATTVEMSLADQVPICVPGVQYAYVIATNEYGQRQYVGLPVGNQRIMYYTSLAGMKGQLIVAGAGVQRKAYDIGTGDEIPSTPIDQAVQAAIKGIICLDTPAEIRSNPESKNGKGLNPLYQVRMTSPSWTEMSGKTTEGEYATGVYVRKVGSWDEPVFYPCVRGTAFVPLGFDVYDIWFVYPNFGNDEPSLPPWWYGGGGEMG